jgi:hypothetical protein
MLLVENLLSAPAPPVKGANVAPFKKLRRFRLSDKTAPARDVRIMTVERKRPIHADH